MTFHKFYEGTCDEYGSFEVFQDRTGTSTYWYWWPCSPGCMPDCEEPTGPFETEQDAIDDAHGDYVAMEAFAR